MSERFTRRSFLESVATGAAVTSLAAADETSPIPTRVLGKTGTKITIVALGCGNRLQRCQVPEMHGLRRRAKLSRGQQAAVGAKGNRLDR